MGTAQKHIRKASWLWWDGFKWSREHNRLILSFLRAICRVLVKKGSFLLEKGSFMLCEEVEVRTLMSWVSHVISSEQEPELDAPNPSLAVKRVLGSDSQGLTPQICVPGITLLGCRMSSGCGFKEFGCPVLAVPSPHLDGGALCVTSTGTLQQSTNPEDSPQQSTNPVDSHLPLPCLSEEQILEISCSPCRLQFSTCFLLFQIDEI